MRNKKNRANAKRIVVLIVIITVLGISSFIAISSLLTESKKLEAPVLSINGELVTYREFKLFIDKCRASTIQKYQNQYNEDSINFWDRDFGGDSPRKYLLDKALVECEKAKIEQILAKTNGIVDDITYGAFLESLELENEKRANAIAKNEVVYGPEVYSESFFYDYLLDDYRLRLKDKENLAGEIQIKPTDEQLKNIYEENKDSQYKNADYVNVYAIYVPYQEKGQETVYTKEKAREKISEAAHKIESGEKFEDVASVYNAHEETRENLGERIFDESSLRNDSKYEKGLREYVEKLNIGQVSAIFEYKSMLGDAGYYIFKCVDRKDTGYKSFEDVKALINQEYTDQKYEELVDETLKRADVKLEKYFYSIGGEEINAQINY